MVDPASEDRHLLAQHDDLDGEVLVCATVEPDQLQDVVDTGRQAMSTLRVPFSASGRVVRSPGAGRRSAVSTRLGAPV